MKNCILCTAQLKFMNTPTFGSGKLMDGGEICTACYLKINKINPKVASKLKSFMLEQIKEMISQASDSANDKRSRADEIKEEIRKLNLDGTSSFFGRKELNELPNILATEERVDNIIQGVYEGRMGILVSTDRRLIFIDKGLLYGLKVEDFPLDKITSIQYETGLLMGSVKIHTSGNISLIDQVPKGPARSFAEFVRNKLSKPKESSATPIIVQAPDLLSQLEKLGELKAKGILSEEEFNEQKKKLLEKL